jgi:hypothetical protein
MNELLKWLGEYSLPVVILIVIGGGFLFVFQKAAEKASPGIRSSRKGA